MDKRQSQIPIKLFTLLAAPFRQRCRCPHRTRVLPAAMAASRSAVIPSDRCQSAPAPADPRCGCDQTRRVRAGARPAGSVVGSGFGNAHHTTQTQLWQRRHGLRQCQGPSGATPTCQAPIHVDLDADLQGVRCAGRWAARRSAILARSTVCIQSKCSATRRVLLFCTGPMQCHCSVGAPIWRSAAIFSTAS